jgi:hypothetical protein
VAFALISVVVWQAGGGIGVFTGILVGGGLSLTNYRLLVVIGRKIFEDPKRIKLHYFVFVWLKFIVLIALCFIIIVYQLVNIPAFFIGMSVIVLAIIPSIIYSILQGFPDMVDEEWQKTEEKYIGWSDVDEPGKIGYKPRGKGSLFDKL